MAAANPAVPDIRQLAADPKFRALEGKDKIAVFSQLDPDFAALPDSDKAGVVSQMINRIPMVPKSKGLFEQAVAFGKTLGKDVAGAAGTALRLTPPGLALDTLKGKPTAAADIAGSQLGQLKQAGQAVKEGRYSEAAGHGLAGAVPLAGPLAAQTGEEIGEGEYGKAGAHLLELGAPYLGKPLAAGARGVAAAGRGSASAVKSGAGVAADVAGLPVVRNIPFVRNLRGMLDDIAGRNPKMSPGELAHGLYKEVNGRAPKTATEKIEAVRMYREAVKANKPEAKLTAEERRLRTPPPVKFNPKAEPEAEVEVEGNEPRKTSGKTSGETAPPPPHARSQVLESRGLAKRNYLAARFEDAGLTPEQVERMSDSDLEKHILDEGKSLQSRGAIKSPFRKYDPGNAANTPYNIMKLEIAKAMRVRAATKAAGSSQ